MQQAAQHRQHTLAAPYSAIATELHDALFPRQLVLIQTLQLGERQVEGNTGQCRAQRAFGIRLGAGLEPRQQVVRLLRGEH